MSFFTKVLGTRCPIMQAPMAGVTTASFVSAVCNAGVIGSHGVAMLSPDQILSDIKQIKQSVSSDALFNINLFVLPKPPTKETQPELSEQLVPIQNVLDRFYAELKVQQPRSYDKYGENFEDQFAVILEEPPPIFSFTFGSLSKEQVFSLKKRNVVVMGTATNTLEAMHLYDIGCDVIVAQGSEAGGHRGTFIGEFDDSMIELRSLVPSINDRIDRKVPVMAAGGIMSVTDMSEIQSLGACGVSMGTVFMNTKECEIPSCYKQALRDSTRNSSTALIDCFSGRPARGIKNRFVNEIEEIKQHGIDLFIPQYPIMNKLTTMMRANAKKQNNTDLMSLWCGSGVGALSKYECDIPVSELVNNLKLSK